MSLATVVAKFSPLLGSALSTVCPIAGLVVKALGLAFGGTTQDEIAANIAGDPDAAVKIKQLETEHEDALLQVQLGIRQGAYEREELVTKATGKGDWCLHFLAISFTLCFFLYSSLALFRATYFDKGMWHDLLNVEMLILSFYFGASYVQSRPVVHPDLTLPPPAQTR